ncbi:MAG: ribbon-helix-helix domain-containing protein [Candidatus Thorarchaeota archaeon]
MPRKKKETGEEPKARVSLREQILGEYSSEEFSTRSRGTHVMTRLSDDIVEAIDALVELGIFKSRSEAVAAFVERSILSKADLYSKLKKQAKHIGAMRDEAMEVALEAFQQTDS